MKYRRFSITDYVIFGLAALGLLSLLLGNPRPFILPILVFGVIALLYFFPPKSRNRKQSVIHPGGRNKNDKKQRRQSGFRVIPGNKRPGDDEEPPKYH